MSEGKQHMKKIAGVLCSMSVLGVAALLVGGQCDPTERPCNNPGECEGDEYPACIQHCVPQIPREDALGMQCVTDPCHPDLVDSGSAILCPTGLTCLAWSGGTHGVCADLHQGLLGACEPQAINTCATGLYCRPFEDAGCEGNPERPDNIPYYADAGGVCAPPIREGGLCDANWGEEGCRACEPGTLCTPDPERGNSLRCRRACDTDDDCPCNEGVDPSVCLGDSDPGDGEADGFCSVCVAHHDECDYRAPDPEMDAYCNSNPRAAGCFEWLSQTPYDCCNAEDDCRLVSLGGGTYPSLSTGVCCEPSGSCETDDDCCPGDLCNPSTNECQPCDGLGDPVEVGCCGDLEDRGDGICRPECDPELIDTECDVCEGVEEKWTCTDETGLECLPVEPTAGDDTTCDGKDDDCDGDIDEDWSGGSSCEFEDSRCDGRTFDGAEVCRGGSVECEPIEDYCVYDYAMQSLVEGNYTDCHQGWRDCETGGHGVCPPNTYCRVNDCWTDENEEPFYGCWPHGMAYGCTGEPYGRDQDCSSGTICWVDGEWNTTGFVCPTAP